MAKIILKLISPAAFASFHGKPTSGPWQELLNIFFGKAFGLWFLFALFWGDLILYWVIRLAHENKYQIACVCLVALILWYIISSRIIDVPGNFFQLSKAPEAVAFVGLGYLMSKPMKKIVEQRDSIILLLLSIFCFTSCVCLLNMLIRSVGLFDLFLKILAACSGFLMIISLAMLVPTWKVLTYIGRNTLIFYGLNGLSLAVTKKIIFYALPVSILHNNLFLQLIVGLFVVALACLLCSIAAYVLKRWFWWGLGMSRAQRR